MEYIGEQLLPKQLGHFAIVFGFVMSLLAATGYFFATRRRAETDFVSWRRIGRAAFTLHGLSVFGVMATMFYVMVEKRFEYQYAWQHVSVDLPFRYIFSAFWEGQEGSFLLWMFWHVVLGFILLWKAKEWESPVLSVLALIQAVIMSMILGIHFTDEFKVGVSPMMLMRDVMDLPLFKNADYLSQLTNGNGLNPLLQNYWMTIHPPTLFLGFASTAIPFCYAIAGLWTRQHKEWLKPAFSWALFSGSILGIGILMGGAWAYEALSFGGYWAWDPVENMSLVPWITLVAGVHTHLIARSTGYSVKSTYLFYIATFVLILYSTFLTRSGILGKTSVHAFTEMGLENQLLALILIFGGLGLGLVIARRKEIQGPKEEEPLPSKEFWMFIGALVLLFSALIITVSTSLPVFNKIALLFNEGFKELTITEPIDHYNRYQLWIAAFIGLLSGGAQFLRFRDQSWQVVKTKFLKHTGIAALAAAALTFATSLWIELGSWHFWLLMFTGMFTIACNMDYLFNFLKGRLKLAGSFFSHVGFGLMIVGIIASGLNKRNISNNPVVQRGLLNEKMIEKNVLIFKDKPMFMSGYRVTYEGDTMVGNIRKFLVNYEKLDEQGNVTGAFKVQPEAIYSNRLDSVSSFNPDTKRYLHQDIFTHIATLPMVEANRKFAQEKEQELKYQTYTLEKDKPLLILDTMELSTKRDTILRVQATIVGINRQPTHPDYKPEPGDIAVGVKVRLTRSDTSVVAEPMILMRGQGLYTLPAQVNDMSMKVRLTEESLDAVTPPYKPEDFKQYTFKEGQEINVNGLKIKFVKVRRMGEKEDKSESHRDTELGIAANFEIDRNGEKGTIEPQFIIKNNSAFRTPLAELPEFGLRMFLSKVNPDQESFEVQIAVGKPYDATAIPVQIAKKSLRTDYIVLEAIIFPGINLFWLGTVLMMFGLGVAMFRRIRERS